MTNLIIWGCGNCGKAAYQYYGSENILFFVDSNPQKWGKDLFDKKICPPQEILSHEVPVVIAMVKNIDAVYERLTGEYNKKDIYVFSVQEKDLHEEAGTGTDNPGDGVVVRFHGGLGNQMFIYALGAALEDAGARTYAGIVSRAGRAPFVLEEVFPHIHLDHIDEAGEKKICLKWLEDYERTTVFYKEDMRYFSEKKADPDLLKIRRGVVDGFFQTCYFAAKCETRLRKDFTFDTNREKALIRLADSMEENSVAVHIRRGDYLTDRNQSAYGGICTEDYYRKALAFLKERIGTCKPYFFSDDMDYVREVFPMKDATYVTAGLFEDYRDWYDMYLMSRCAHNIIANSTFSWWGAWLNRNPDKVVIAPTKWVNVFDYTDIYPGDWIKIDTAKWSGS